MTVRHHRGKGHPKAILRAEWASSGQITTTERLFDCLCADDPGGRLPQGRMYSDLRAAIEAVYSVPAGTLQIAPIRNQSG